ncbi:uncharacterized protein LOC100678411 isoform X2 [Nasonia vitripennis]|uniref:Uncharacterized protein n=1 Tax=Nasonia vitripennis TaxID=7425 RepID=A0A7M7T841_NASVI|nr:uncharacterized protein LOC100678411 isoform X2 [Nasonia vitripennis]
MTAEPAKIYEIELRELEPLLRKSLADDELEILDYHTEPLLKLGENYGSTILKVRVEIRKNDGKEESLETVAKMLPGSDFQRMIFDSSYSFRKEAFLYGELIPSYQRLEREFGVKDVFYPVPKLYGVRFSLKGGDEFDDDAVILMENLKVWTNKSSG